MAFCGGAWSTGGYDWSGRETGRPGLGRLGPGFHCMRLCAPAWLLGWNVCGCVTFWPPGVVPCLVGADAYGSMVIWGLGEAAEGRT